MKKILAITLIMCMMLLMAVNAFANTTDNLKEIDSTIREAAYKIRHITAFEGIASKYLWEVSEDSWEIGDTTLGADHPVSGYDANAYYIIKDFKNKNEIYAFFEEAFTEEYSKKIVDNFGLPGNMELFKQHTDGNVYICSYALGGDLKLPCVLHSVKEIKIDNDKATATVIRAYEVNAREYVDQGVRAYTEETIELVKLSGNWKISGGSFFEVERNAKEIKGSNIKTMPLNEWSQGTVNTGDTSTMIYITLAVASLCGIAIVAKRRKANA
ncbi:MAG: LPXTG cell wall anchor domain-containing protein [Clostridia bacterium]|nr:LPXTG cell wall anchor domain-containing protein [Clostridia bacterium]